jgi:glutaredoxin
MKIKVYTIPACPFCSKLKDLLDADKIEYEAVDVSLDEHEKEFDEMMKLSGSESVPMVTVGKNLLAPDVNFSSIEQAVKLIKYIQENETE